MRGLDRLSSETRTVYLAALAAFALGLVFIFVRAPHPWGWEGIDGYHERALALARGKGYGTIEYPWGYALYLAAFYRFFGDRPALALVTQAVVNATIPVMLYWQAADGAGRRPAVIAAALAGAFSFNTVYASTQAPDAVCNAIVVGAVLAFVEGRRRDDWRWLAAAGALVGLASQFQPNLMLLPALLAVLRAVRPGTWRPRAVDGLVLVASAGLALMPWTIRSYRLTGLFLPVSVHGSQQLWYGTLQTGSYLARPARNPASVFASPSFDYTTPTHLPLVVQAAPRACAPARPESIELVYWSDRADPPRRTDRAHERDGIYEFEVPVPPAPATFYYYFDVRWPGREHPTHRSTPPEGVASPYVFFVSTDHLTDLDRHEDLLDVFDVVRLARHVAWGETIPWADRVDLTHDGRVDEADIRRAIAVLTAGDDRPAGDAADRLQRLETDDSRAQLTLTDASTVTIPRAGRRLTDVTFEGDLARVLASASRSFTSLALQNAQVGLPVQERCLQLEKIGVNRASVRTEVQRMRRYAGLARDNISRAPMAYLAASAYRAARLFVIADSADPFTAQPSIADGHVMAFQAINLVSVALCAAGFVVAIRRRADVLLFAALIAYVPATVCFTSIDMRYAVTVQPYILLFAAIALDAVIGKARRAPDSWETNSPGACPTN